LIETVPIGIDDNVTVPLSSGLFLWALYQIQPDFLFTRQNMILHNLMWGALINFAFGGTAFALRVVRLSGFIGGFIVGTLIYTFGGYQLYLILITFFVLGTGKRRSESRRKKAGQGAGRMPLPTAPWLHSLLYFPCLFPKRRARS
jgi:hypothetical protein